MSSVATQPEHITNLMMGHVNTNVPDVSPMWRGFRDNRYKRSYMVINMNYIYEIINNKQHMIYYTQCFLFINIKLFILF